MFGIAEHLGKRRKHVSMENVSSEELCCYIVWDVRVVWSGLGEYPRDVKTSTVQPQKHLKHAMKNRCLSESKSILAENTDVRCTDVLLSDLLDTRLLLQVIYILDIQMSAISS